VVSGVLSSGRGVCTGMVEVCVRRLSRRGWVFYDVCRCNV